MRKGESREEKIREAKKEENDVEGQRRRKEEGKRGRQEEGSDILLDLTCRKIKTCKNKHVKIRCL